jgi:hypothetical protein
LNNSSWKMNKVIEKIEDICNNITVCCVCNEKITIYCKNDILCLGGKR